VIRRGNVKAHDFTMAAVTIADLIRDRRLLWTAAIAGASVT
jgi:hypothetical protein